MKKLWASILGAVLAIHLNGIGLSPAWANPKAKPNLGSLPKQALQIQGLFNSPKFEDVKLDLPGQPEMIYRVPILQPRISPGAENSALEEVKQIGEGFSKIQEDSSLPSEAVRGRSDSAWEKKRMENGGELWLPVQASAAKADQNPAPEQQSSSDRTPKPADNRQSEQKSPPRPEAAADEAKQRAYFNAVSHDLRNPLTVIVTVLKLMKEGGADQNRYLGMALNNAERMGHMINDLLDNEKIRLGKMTVQPLPVSASQMAREAVENLQPLADRKQLTLTAKADQDLPEVLADSMQTVHRVLGNLISNAVKFTPAGGSIEVEAAQDRNSPKFVTFSVKDTGPGLSKEEQEKLFQAYAQTESGKDQPVGTGLGLSNAKALVELQNGRIWVESEPGKGTKFSFTLPVNKKAADAK